MTIRTRTYRPSRVKIVGIAPPFTCCGIKHEQVWVEFPDDGYRPEMAMQVRDLKDNSDGEEIRRDVEKVKKEKDV